MENERRFKNNVLVFLDVTNTVNIGQFRISIPILSAYNDVELRRIVFSLT